MQNAKFIIGALLLAGSAARTQASTQESYVCTGKQATGFSFNARTREWTVSHFRERQYLIRTPKQGPDVPPIAQTSAMAVYVVGDQDWTPMYCKDGFNSDGYLFCEGLGDDFKFNRKTLRFAHSFPFGYIDPPAGSFWGPEGAATPFIEIGTCSGV